jgi:hypothetical protein
MRPLIRCNLPSTLLSQSRFLEVADAIEAEEITDEWPSEPALGWLEVGRWALLGFAISSRLILSEVATWKWNAVRHAPFYGKPFIDLGLSSHAV